MTTPTFNIAQDPTATFAAYSWLVNKVDDGVEVVEAEVDEVIGAVWANGVDEALIQVNEVFQGSRTVDALTVTTLSLTGTLNPNGGITFDNNTDLITWTGGGALRAGAADKVEVRNGANNAYGSFQCLDITGTNAFMSGSDIRFGAGQVALGSNDIASFCGGATSLLGVRVQDVTTNSTNKNGRFVVGAYDNSQNPAIMMAASCQAASNIVLFGGGSSTAQAATTLRFYTASAVNTATGTLQWAIDGTGAFYPQTTNATDIGYTSNRVRTVFAVDGDFSDDVTVGDALTVTGVSALNGGVTFDANTDTITWSGGGALRGGAADKIEVRNNANGAMGALECAGLTATTVATTGAISTTINGTHDIGTSSLQFRDIWCSRWGGFGRLIARGTAATSGNVTLSAGWGTTASVSTISANDLRGRIAVTANGASIAANPTVIYTFADGTFSAAPLAFIVGAGVSGTTAAGSRDWVWTGTSATTVTFTYIGTPVAGTIYEVAFILIR